MMTQSSYDVAFDWGLQGIEHLAPSCEAIVIVDILSFTTCVDIACERGATVFPYQWKDSSAQEYARSIGAELAGSRNSNAALTLSPQSFSTIESGMRIVLPSPNGSVLSVAQRERPVFAASFRNVAAVGEYLCEAYSRIGVIAAGERWPDGSLRPAIEDLIGAGAVIDRLSGRCSPEAEIARAAFGSARTRLKQIIGESVSGRELLTRGYPTDIELAAELDVSLCVPLLGDEHGFHRAN